jgi:hypothetical protein
MSLLFFMPSMTLSCTCFCDLRKLYGAVLDSAHTFLFARSLKDEIFAPFPSMVLTVNTDVAEAVIMMPRNTCIPQE